MRRCFAGWDDKCGAWTSDPFNDYCYLFNYLSIRTWAEARADCTNQGGHLASITDPFEQAFIQGAKSPACFYYTPVFVVRLHLRERQKKEWVSLPCCAVILPLMPSQTGHTQQLVSLLGVAVVAYLYIFCVTVPRLS